MNRQIQTTRLDAAVEFITIPPREGTGPEAASDPSPGPAAVPARRERLGSDIGLPHSACTYDRANASGSGLCRTH